MTSDETIKQQPHPVPLKEHVKKTIKKWSVLTTEQIIEHVIKRDFIIDQWGVLDDYQELNLGDGWEVKSTSLSTSLPGTIYISPVGEQYEKMWNKSVKQYLVNYGLSSSQAETFMTTHYFAKYKILEILVSVFNDQKLYVAYRQWKKGFKQAEYLEWLNKYSVDRVFNAKLDDSDRHHVSELIKRMIHRDRALAPKRRERKLQREQPK